MLTRIEIDGFKTFRDFALDLPPFLVVLGRNGAGKSNLFDALRFLSRLAHEPLAKAAPHARGELPELFHQDTEGRRETRMRFAVEVTLDREVTDDFGATAALPDTRVRYELVIEQRSARLFVAEESARPIPSGSGRDRPFLDTVGTTFLIRRDAEGAVVSLPATGAVSTVLSVIGTVSESATLFALKRELSSWRHLHLDPAALRRPDGFDDPAELAADGAHLPNTLHRIAETTGSGDRPKGLLGDISADLAGVISDVSGIRVDEDTKRRRREVEFRARGGGEPVSARVASDGTLRAAALLTAAYDPANSGLLCFEEPENGIYPQRLVTLVRRLHSVVERAVERRSSDPAAPLVQLLLSSHSPAILRALDPSADAVFLTTVTRVFPGRSRSRITQPRLIGSGERPSLADQDARDPNERLISPAEIAEFEVRQVLEA
ncbi:AAA family ATPase [Actinoplanes sp. NPDC051851]|uniref:AAA family ATPase n=1 Tax=Actinoplanes sp. NPDC051851 TaxID=3154753 RepID=UPI00341CC591